MTDLQATLDAIDEVAVHECGHCRKPLRDDGPSADYCNEACQTAYLGDKQRVATLTGYREPVDLMYGGATPAPVRPGGYATPADIRADLNAMRALLSQEPARRYARDESAAERVQAGQWLAHFAAPWHPRACGVRAEYGRPPLSLNAARMREVRFWRPDDGLDMEPAFELDVYRLESVNEHDRSAIYRIQGLPGPRYAVFRYADGRPPTWWMRGGWEGRWVEIENSAQGHARGHRWSYPSGQTVTATPTERYESREDGAVAEVWAAAPDHDSMRRAPDFFPGFPRHLGRTR
jgi:hypothetical protein